MPSREKLIGGAALAALLLLSAAGAARAASPPASGTKTLRGHVPSQLRRAKRLERVAADENMDLSLVVNLDRALLDKTLADLYGPQASPNRRFLTSAEFIEKFGLARKRQALKDFAAGAGLALKTDDDQPGSLVVKVSGPAGRVESAFGVRMYRYRAADGRVFRAHETDPVVPAALAEHLQAVMGLSNYSGASKPHLVQAPALAGTWTAGAASTDVARPSLSFSGNGFGGGLSPTDIKSVYGVTGSQTGTGQTAALLELDGYNGIDITRYEGYYGLPSPSVVYSTVDAQADLCGPPNGAGFRIDPCNSVTYNGGQSDQGGTGDSNMAEVALDIEMMVTLAPGVSQILVYTAPDTNQGVLDAYAKIASDNTAKTVSTSWGAPEADYGGAYLASEYTTFQQMAAQGQSIFAAAGDHGAYDTIGSLASLNVDDPASQPYVTAVGGTSLSGSDSTPSESVWNDGCVDSSNATVSCSATGASFIGGGGGVASYCEDGSGNPESCGALGATAYWSLPTWQSGVAGEASSSLRNVPDVSLNADPYSAPYTVFVGCSSSQCPVLAEGGTSAAAPLWAALTALVNQQRAANGYTTLGFANPALYQIGTGSSYSSNFKDITTGGNGAYNAGIGYDNASGLGTFKGSALINALGVPAAPSGAVTGLTALTLGTSSIQYSWNALAGVTGYDIYYATNTSSALLLHTTSLTFNQIGLLPDQQSGITVYGENQGNEGPGAFIVAATNAQSPASAPNAIPFASSDTFAYPACPAFPSPSSCSGYEVQASVAPNFTGTVISSATSNPALLSLTMTGLSPNTGYYMRLGYLNPLGVPAFGPAGTFNTGTNLVAPNLPSFTQITTGTIVFGWGQASNPNGITYLSEASPQSNFSGTPFARSGTALSAVFGGLSADTSYYFSVQGVGGPTLTAGPQATLAASPAATAAPFPVVGTNSLSVAWSSGGDQSDTLYQVQLSSYANFSAGVMTAQVRSPSASFSGLVANTRYYAEVEAIGRTGLPTGYVSLGSTTTSVQPPTLPSQPFSNVTAGGFQFSFNQTDPAGTQYVVDVATSAGFGVLAAAAATTSSSTVFSGLLSNQIYYAEVAALNLVGSPSSFAVAAPVATAVSAPLPAAIPVTTETATSFGFQWGAGTLAPGTVYLARISSSPVFASAVTSTSTPNAFATYSGLQPNTTYYAQVEALSQNPPTPNGPFLSSAAVGATLPNAPQAVASPFAMVAYTSATVAWSPLPLAPQSAAAEGYLVQFATSADFTTVAAWSAAPPGASSATVLGLAYATPFFARVGAVGWEGLANFLALGSTTTELPPLSSGTVTGSGISLSVPPAFSQIKSINVFVPPNAFPSGTSIVAVANVAVLPPPVTNEASAITPFGAGVGVVITANGLQPASPVTISMAYDFMQIPAGQSEGRLQLFRYDPNSAQWTLVPSYDDPVGHVLTAQTPHFSTFAPFFVSAGTDVDSVQVFPQPWEIGDPSSQYWAGALTFSGLPAAASVKVFAITGELVWSGTAAGSGVLTWNGLNRFGRKAASGTYYAVFTSGGQTKTRRVVIIR
jgi:kumamolisin